MPIPTLRRADNGFYYAHWSEGGRSKRTSMGVKEEADAKERFAQWLLVGGQEGSEAVDYAIADLWPIYEEKHVRNPAEVAAPASIEFAWKNLKLHFGTLSLTRIDQDVVDDYGRKRAAGRIGRPAKPSTVRKELGMLRAALNWCADPTRKIIAPTQVPAFNLPESGEPRDRWLRTEEIQRLLDAATAMRRQNKHRQGKDRLSRGERFLWLALETAARKEALLELTWDRVDFETNVIHLNVPGRRVTKKRRADVPISKALRPTLVRAYAERLDKRANGLVLDSGAEIWATVQIIAERAGFAEVTKRKAGEKPKGTGISPHVLRHTAATHMARRGVPLWIIAKILGNTLAMVEKVYAKHCPDDLREAVDMISGGYLEAAE